MKVIQIIIIVLALSSNLQGQCCLNRSNKSDWTKILAYESKEEISIKKKIKIKVKGFLGFSSEEDFEIHLKINCYAQSYYKTPCKFDVDKIKIYPIGRLTGKLMDTDEYKYTWGISVFFDTSLKFEDGSIFSLNELVETNSNFDDYSLKIGRLNSEALGVILKKPITKVLFKYEIKKGSQTDIYQDEFSVTGGSKYMLMNFAKCVIGNKVK